MRSTSPDGSAPRALITGVTGQDGSYLAEHLLGLGYEVYGLIRRAATDNTENIRHLMPGGAMATPAFRPRVGDLLDPGGLVRLLAEIRPGEIYNLGAQSRVDVSFQVPAQTLAINTQGALHLLEAARAVAPGARIYQASSSEMFGQAAEQPQRETTPFHPRSPYAVAKAAAYWMAVNYRESYGLFVCNGILFNHESPRRGRHFVTRKIAAAAARIERGLQRDLRLGDLDAARDWGYAPEYVRAMRLMLRQPEPGDYVVATGVSRSVRDFAAAAFAACGLDWREHVRQDPALLRPAEVPALRGDASKARSVLGWAPEVSFEGLVRILVDAERARLDASPGGGPVDAGAGAP